MQQCLYNIFPQSLFRQLMMKTIFIIYHSMCSNSSVLINRGKYATEKICPTCPCVASLILQFFNLQFPATAHMFSAPLVCSCLVPALKFHHKDVIFLLHSHFNYFFVKILHKFLCLKFGW